LLGPGYLFQAIQNLRSAINCRPQNVLQLSKFTDLIIQHVLPIIAVKSFLRKSVFPGKSHFSVR